VISRSFKILCSTGLCFLGIGLLSPVALGINRQARERALQAVVELVPLEALPVGAFALNGYTVDGFRFVRATGPGWVGSGSGSMVSATGLVLTNAHVVSGRNGFAPLVEVRMTLQPDQAARPSYLARVTHLDQAQDLAALQIVTDTNGKPVSLENLKVIPIGDSNSLTLGDDLAVMGYPQVGGETITYTAGRVSGFVGENLRNAGRAFIKTDAKFSSGSSGGSALDEDGRLIGIPTAIAFDHAGGAPQESQNYLRPIALALEMLRKPISKNGETRFCLETSPDSSLRKTHAYLFAACSQGRRSI
jgi:S1-C subfamily serine protease